VIFKPTIIALVMGSALMSILLFYSCYYAVLILQKWDLRSGSELQLGLENRTYLISTIMAYAFSFQIVSLFLFVHTADHLHTFFVGAMCAAGTLNTSGWGYPVLLLKVFNFMLAGLWLILNFADNKGYDYPLIRKKYLLLLVIAPLILAEGLAQADYFGNLTPDIITSCCGKLFSGDAAGITSDISVLAPKWVMAVFFCVVAGTIALGIVFIRNAKWGYLYSLAAFFVLVLSLAAILSFISPYFYELPTHHCPFCILQAEYGYIGYPIYICLFGGGLSGMGVALLMPFGHIVSLRETLPLLQRRLALLSVVFFGIFLLMVAYRMSTSNLIV
jgi:hypothetical protein